MCDIYASYICIHFLFIHHFEKRKEILESEQYQLSIVAVKKLYRTRKFSLLLLLELLHVCVTCMYVSHTVYQRIIRKATHWGSELVCRQDGHNQRAILQSVFTLIIKQQLLRYRKQSCQKNTQKCGNQSSIGLYLLLKLKCIYHPPASGLRTLDTVA